MQIFFLEEEEPVRRAAWVIGHCAETHPDLMKPWLKPMLRKMKQPHAHCAVKRNGVRILQIVEIPQSLKGTVADLCFTYLTSIDEPIAVRTFSMTVLAKIAQDEPDLQKEIESTVRQMMPYSTPAFISRVRKVFKNIRKELPENRLPEDFESTQTWMRR
jgi:hypothetical protein